MEKQTLIERLTEVGPELVQRALRQLLSPPITITVVDDLARERLGKICVVEINKAGAVTETRDWRDESLARTQFPLVIHLADAEGNRFGPATLRETQLLFA